MGDRDGLLEDIKMKPNWLEIDEQPPQPPTVTFEERQAEWQRTHYPRLWEYMERLWQWINDDGVFKR